MGIEERIVEVMGTTAHVIVTDGPRGLAERAVERLDQLETRWSRFQPTSEISRLNTSPGAPVVVSRETYQLIERALEGWRLTAGLFDPTLLPELRVAGYDRSFELIGTSNGPSDVLPMTGIPGALLPSRPGAAQINLDPIVGTVQMGAGVEFDPGGIGKGLAADLVVDLILAEGAQGALVNVGGDLRAAGTAPEGHGWVVAIADPADSDRVMGTVALEAGAMASTWRTKRAWTAPDGTRRHHLIDPRTGAPAATGLAGVTVVVGQAWHAEVLAKAAFLAGPSEGAEMLAANNAAGLLISDDGSVRNAGAWSQFSGNERLDDQTSGHGEA